MRALLSVPLFFVSVHLLAQPQPGWLDPSPHVVRTVPVEPGTTIEVLDWGGPGRTLILLAQLGQTAHLYDDWALKLRGAYRVLGITRRGHGESVMAPDAAMSTDRLGADVVAVMDWEQPSLGGALQDLAWFLTLSETMHGKTSQFGAWLDGMGSREETIALWETITGKSAAGIEWYEDFTQLKMSCTGVRMDGMRGTDMIKPEYIRARLKL